MDEALSGKRREQTFEKQPKFRAKKAFSFLFRDFASFPTNFLFNFPIKTKANSFVSWKNGEREWRKLINCCQLKVHIFLFRLERVFKTSFACHFNRHIVLCFTCLSLTILNHIDIIRKKKEKNEKLIFLVLLRASGFSKVAIY